MDEYYTKQLSEIRREVDSAFDDDHFHTWPENVQWLFTSLQRCLEVIDQQQAVIDAAHSVRRIPAHKDGPGHDMALESLYAALDALNGTEPDAAGSGER